MGAFVDMHLSGTFSGLGGLFFLTQEQAFVIKWELSEGIPDQ